MDDHKARFNAIFPPTYAEEDDPSEQWFLCVTCGGQFADKDIYACADCGQTCCEQHVHTLYPSEETVCDGCAVAYPKRDE